MTSADPIESPDTVPSPGLIVPVLEERLHLSKRSVESGKAQVHITVSDHEEAIEAMLMRQDVAIERVPVGRDIAEPPPIRTEGDTIVIPVLEERLVLVKQLVLKEELRIRITETLQPTTQIARVRREHADVSQSTETGDHP